MKPMISAQTLANVVWKPLETHVLVRFAEDFDDNGLQTEGREVMSIADWKILEQQIKDAFTDTQERWFCNFNKCYETLEEWMAPISIQKICAAEAETVEKLFGVRSGWLGWH